jgi:poly(3-hydroxyalkanoate) depolymerase
MVSVGQSEIRVAQRNTGERPLLLINGIGAHLDMWEPFANALAAQALIAFDLPGTGESPRARCPQRMPRLAKLVNELLAALGQTQVDVLGISFGGALAQEFTRHYPDRVRRLVLCATSSGIVSVPPRPMPLLYLMTPLRYVHPVFFNFMMPRIVGGRTARERTALASQMETRLSHPPDPLGYAFQLYAASGWTSVHYLQHIRQPTLVLAGEDDRAIPVRNAKLLARLLPNAQLHVVRDGGHAFLLDEPESVAPLIESFLASD